MKPVAHPQPPRRAVRRSASLAIEASALGVAILLALGGCGDTEGVSSAFKKANTTNSDFVLHTIATADYPIGLAKADFGTTKGFVVSNYLAGSVSVFKQSGGPSSTTFTRQDFAVGDHPTQLIVADLHSDPAHPDIAVVTETAQTNNVVVLLNDGSENFTVNSQYISGEIIQQITADCFQTQCDTSGTPTTTAVDLVISLPASQEVRVLTNDGAGNFTAVSHGLGQNPGRFAVADFNGDGHQDLAVNLPAKDQVRILLGDGSGNFPSDTAYATARYPIAIAAGAFGPTADIDLAISGRDEDRVSLFLGDGAGGFPAIGFESVVDQPGDLIIADFSGNPDIVVPNRGKKVISVFVGNGAGGFSGYDLGSTQDPFDIADGLFTAGGNRDMVVAELHDRVLGVYQGNGAGGFSRTQVAFDETVAQPTRVNFCGSVTHDDVLLVQSSLDRVVLLCNVH